MFEDLKGRLKKTTRENIDYYAGRVSSAQEFLQVAHDNDDVAAMQYWSKVLRGALRGFDTHVILYKLFGGNKN